MDFDWLAKLAAALGADPSTTARIGAANSAGAVLAIAAEADIALADQVAARARLTALGVLAGATAVEVLVFDRNGRLVGSADG